jgi:tetratricopeptide (TPR) repeat protein
MRRSALAIAIVLASIAGACKPVPVASPPAGGQRYPDYVYPAPPDKLGDARTRTRHQSAWSRLQMGDLRGADGAFASLVSQQASFYPAAAGLGYTLLAEGKVKEATGRFDAALRQAPKYAPALAGRAEARLAAGQRDEAIEGFEAALAADRSLADLRRRIDALKFDRVQDRIVQARRAADAGRLDDARDAYAAALAASPDSAFLYRDLGLVELRRKNVAEAGRNIEKAIALDPSDAKAHAGLSDVFEARGDVDGAAAELEKAYALDPSPALKQRLDRLHERAQSSGLPPEYAGIQKAPQATRGDLAALIGVRLRLVLAAARTRTSGVATDVRGHWASRWIVEVIRAGVMDVFPNHTFQPHAVVRRADLAQAASRVLAISGRGGAAPARGRVAISDVGPEHLSYADIAAAVSSGAMLLDGGAFHPARVVSGREATETIQRLERLAAPARGGSR